MKIYTLRKEQKINLPQAEVFEFFKKPENLEMITPKSLGFEILTPKPIPMKAGQEVNYKIRIFGIPVQWTTQIKSFNPPDGFEDVQLRGPYSFWEHKHCFESVDGGTLMTDEVRYSIPLGMIGRLAHALYVKEHLWHIFDYRSRVIEEVFAGKPGEKKAQ